MVWSRDKPNFVVYSLLFLVTYVFLLRLPSEALPLRNGKCDDAPCLYMEDGKLVVKLIRRYADRAT